MQPVLVHLVAYSVDQIHNFRHVKTLYAANLEGKIVFFVVLYPKTFSSRQIHRISVVHIIPEKIKSSGYITINQNVLIILNHFKEILRKVECTALLFFSFLPQFYVTVWSVELDRICINVTCVP